MGQSADKERARLMRRLGDLMTRTCRDRRDGNQDTGLPIIRPKMCYPTLLTTLIFKSPADNGKTYPVDDKMLNYTLVQSVGVFVALVSPWNVPFIPPPEGRAVSGRQYRGTKNVGTLPPTADRLG